MGDSTKQEECEAFIEEFAEDAVRIYGIHLPNSRDVTAQNNELRTHEGWMEVYLYAEIDSGDRTWTVMVPEVLFNPDWSDSDRVHIIAKNLELTPQEAARRLCDAHLVDTVLCQLCLKQAPAETAHRHSGGYVGDECCWDERLRSSE